MGPHEVVNGANGSVTWCQGPPFCPQCLQGARACERVGSATPQGQPAIRLGGDAMPPWGYQILGIGYPLGYRVVG
jgi:hypothetical protein